MHVLLLSRPPYLRWIAAVSIVIAAVGWDLSKRSTEPFPYAAIDIERGAVVTEDMVRWEEIGRGSIPYASSLDHGIGMVAAIAIAAGDPITRSVVQPGSPIPADWWSVPVNLPAGVSVGSRVRLASTDGLSVNGIVSIEASSDQFGLTATGAVAVPEADASRVSVAAATDSLIVLIGP